MKQMLTHPGTLHVWGEGDGVCEGKRERGKWIQDYAVERGCAPG